MAQFNLSRNRNHTNKTWSASGAIVLLALALALAMAGCSAAPTPAPTVAPAPTAAPAQPQPTASVPPPAPIATAAPTAAPTALPAPTATTTAPTAQPTAAAKTVSFTKDVLPIFQQSCVKCHGGEKTEEGLALTTHGQVIKGSSNGPILKAGDAANSLLVQQLANGKMPKRATKLPQAQIDIVATWVDTGAPNN